MRFAGWVPMREDAAQIDLPTSAARRSRANAA
jgi:hypothetical protein